MLGPSDDVPCNPSRYVCNRRLYKNQVIADRSVLFTVAPHTAHDQASHEHDTESTTHPEHTKTNKKSEFIDVQEVKQNDSCQAPGTVNPNFSHVDLAHSNI